MHVIVETRSGHARWVIEKRAKAGENGPIRKDEFTWDPAIPGYRCPQGNPLMYRERTTKQKANGDSLPLEIYQANASRLRKPKTTEAPGSHEAMLSRPLELAAAILRVC